MESQIQATKRAFHPHDLELIQISQGIESLDRNQYDEDVDQSGVLTQKIQLHELPPPPCEVVMDGPSSLAEILPLVW